MLKIDHVFIYKMNFHCDLFASITMTFTTWDEPGLSLIISEVLYSEHSFRNIAVWDIRLSSYYAEAFLFVACSSQWWYLLVTEGRVSYSIFIWLSHYPGSQFLSQKGLRTTFPAHSGLWPLSLFVTLHKWPVLDIIWFCYCRYHFLYSNICQLLCKVFNVISLTLTLKQMLLSLFYRWNGRFKIIK